MVKIFLGLLTCDSAELGLLPRFWDSFNRWTPPAVRSAIDVFWIDNNSVLDTTRTLMERSLLEAGVRVVGKEFWTENTGIVKPRNHMLKFAMRNVATYDWLVLANEDLVFEGDWIAAAEDAFSWHLKNGRVTIQDNTSGTPTARGAVEDCGGIFWILRPAMVQEIGLIHTKFTWLMQDIEYSRRIYDWGWRTVLMRPPHVIRHAHVRRQRAEQEFPPAARIDNFLGSLLLQHVNSWHLWRTRRDYLDPRMDTTNSEAFLSPGDASFARIDEVDYA